VRYRLPINGDQVSLEGSRTGSNPVLTTKIKNMKEVLFYVLGFIFILFISLGLFGAFDKDKDNPFK
jgi:hypothetical protein